MVGYIFTSPLPYSESLGQKQCQLIRHSRHLDSGAGKDTESDKQIHIGYILQSQ